MKRFVGFLKSTYMGLALLFMYAPIAILIIFSFNESKTMAKWGGFSFKWYGALFHDPTIMNALWVTLSVAVLSALIATVLGTFAAIGIHSMRKGPRALVMGISNLPVINPDLVTGISLMLLFIFLGIPLGYTTLLLAHITFNIPYVILSVMPRLRQMPNSMYEAALDLGATPSYALFKVVIPEIMPGIVTGLIFAFTLSLDDFVISFFTRQGVQNLSIVVYSMARRGINPKINALSALMFVTVLVLLLIVNLRDVRSRKGRGKEKLKKTPTPAESA